MKSKKEETKNSETDMETTKGVDNQLKENVKEETPTEEKTSLVSDDVILKAKKLSPQYKKFYINAKGFVFVPGTPEKMMGEAILVENEFYNK